MPTLILIPEEKKWRVFLAGALVFAGCYFGSALSGKDHATVLNWTFFDYQIPFLSWTVWFYISQYMILPISFAWVKRTENYSPMFYSMMMAIVLSCTIFFLYPTAIHRPETLDGSFIDSIRWLLYQVDAPTNCFPSLHVALACLSAIYVRREHGLFGNLFWVWSILIIVSTMTLKQHYVIDVIGGMVIAFLSHRLTLVLIKGNLKPLTIQGKSIHGPRAI